MICSPLSLKIGLSRPLASIHATVLVSKLLPGACTVYTSTSSKTYSIPNLSHQFYLRPIDVRM